MQCVYKLQALTPFFQAKARHHHSFFKTMLSLLTMTIAVMLAAPSGGSSLGLGAQLVTAMVALDTIAATLVLNVMGTVLVDAAIQEVLVGLRIKDFSYSELIQSGFAAAANGLRLGFEGLSGGAAMEAAAENSLRLLSLTFQNSLL